MIFGLLNSDFFYNNIFMWLPLLLKSLPAFTITLYIIQKYRVIIYLKQWNLILVLLFFFFRSVYRIPLLSTIILSISLEVSWYLFKRNIILVNYNAYKTVYNIKIVYILIRFSVMDSFLTLSFLIISSISSLSLFFFL